MTSTPVFLKRFDFKHYLSDPLHNVEVQCKNCSWILSETEPVGLNWSLLYGEDCQMYPVNKFEFVQDGIIYYCNTKLEERGEPVVITLLDNGAIVREKGFEIHQYFTIAVDQSPE